MTWKLINLIRLYSFSQFRVLVRGFSSSAARNAGLVKAPVQVFGTEGRYAAALFSAASKNKALDVVEKDLATFQVSCLSGLYAL